MGRITGKGADRPGDGIGVGIVGVGGIAWLHAEGYQRAGARLVALADVNSDVLHTRQQEWGADRVYASAEQMVADPEVEAISICTPNAFHHPATLAAAAAGVHVLCEKPLTLDLDLAREMIDRCHDAGVVLQTSHQLRSDGAAAMAKGMIERGELGRVCFVRLRQGHDWGGLGVRPSFATKASSGGGTLLDNGCHMFDLARYFGGEVATVFAQTATLAYDIELEDTAQVSLTFASGALGSLEAQWTATGWEEGFWIYGTEGSLEYTNRLGVPKLRHSFRASPGTTWGTTDVSETAFAGARPHHRHVANFLAAIEERREPICSGEDGLEAVRLVLASYRSAREGRPVPVDAAPVTLP